MAITLLGVSVVASGGELTTVLAFSPQELVFERADGYDIVKLRDCGFTHRVGQPLLPSIPYLVAIPPAAVLTGIEVLSSEIVEISGTYLIHPAQLPRPISFEEEPPFAEPSRLTYGSLTPYPGDIVEMSHAGSMGGYRIGGFLLYPLQYIPSEQKLRLHATVTLRITYKEDAASAQPRTMHQREVFGERVRKMVLNPEDVERWAPPLRDPEQGTTEYAIVTTDTYVSALQAFADWKTKRGVPTEIKTISWINSNYGGHFDTQENIREFLKDYYANHGLIWVLLAGDISVVPHRIAKVVTPYHGTGYLPCDLYYSDLDRDWDANGNHVYGEIGDNVDMYSDVCVGRASIDNSTQASTFINKVFTFEKDPPTGYLKKICLPAVLLWPGYYGDVVNDAIANYTPSGWQDVKLYESQGTLSRTILRNNLNSGFQFCHGAAHGDANGWYYYYGWILFNSADAYGLYNGDNLTIVNSIACISGGFDQGSYNSDCLAENFVTNPNGGAVASIMNSRYGWGTPPSMGPSERLDAKFYSCLFWSNIYRIGETHAASKDNFVSQAQGDEYMRWCIYELNLFGDPEMPMWTEVPESMTVDHPQSVPSVPQNFLVTVTHDGTPVENALVCVMDSTVYEHGYTNASGEVTFPIDPLVLDTLLVTVTAYNHYPYEGECLVELGVEEMPKSQIPITRSQLYQNSPNPFTATTTIPYSVQGSKGAEGQGRNLSTYQLINVSVYDLTGRLVRTLVDGKQEPGLHRVVWDGRDEYGHNMPSGVYFCNLKVGTAINQTRRMVLVK